MENASKALIIAGAILVSLIIIALGVLIVNRMSSTVNKASLNSEEAQAHNSKFDSYFGDKVTATEVKSLLKTIAANNVTAGTSDELKKIYVYFSPQSGSALSKGWASITSISSAIRSGYTYKVYVYNDYAYDVGELGNGNGGATSSAAKSDACNGYYKSGFIQAITITENAKGSGV